MKRPTAQHFIELLEATHLIYRLQPFGYGKEVLRGRFRIYLADPAIAPAVMLRGKALPDDPVALGAATEAAIFTRLVAHYAARNARFTYWRGTRDREVDVVAEVDGQLIPYEVKYRAQHAGAGDVKGLLEFCGEKQVEHGYVVTRSLRDFGPMPGLPANMKTRIMRIPAPLLCYWTGEADNS